MKKFLVLYETSASAAEQMANATPEQRKAGMEAWMAWAKRAASGLVDLGNPVGKGFTVDGAGASNGTPKIGGFSVLQAESEQAVRGLLANHPHLMMPGTAIHVLEFLPMPGM